MNKIAQQRKKIGVSQAVLASAIGWGQTLPEQTFSTPWRTRWALPVWQDLKTR